MTTLVIAGVILTLIGLGGSLNACQTATDPDHIVAALSGLSLAAGLVCIAVGAARRGYHRRPLGAPPGDMDPDKVNPSGPPPGL